MYFEMLPPLLLLNQFQTSEVKPSSLRVHYKKSSWWSSWCLSRGLRYWVSKIRFVGFGVVTYPNTLIALTRKKYAVPGLSSSIMQR